MQSPQLIFGDINSNQNLVEFLHVKCKLGEGNNYQLVAIQI